MKKNYEPPVLVVKEFVQERGFAASTSAENLTNSSLFGGSSSSEDPREHQGTSIWGGMNSESSKKYDW